jgi:Crp-like helix-turn-helix domain
MFFLTGSNRPCWPRWNRTCRWSIGVDLPLTQEFLARMMGVRRTTVTEVAGDLQKAGMITYSRGRIHILNLEQIRQWACECDEDVRSHYRRMFYRTKSRVRHSCSKPGSRCAMPHCNKTTQGRWVRRQP